MTNSRPMSDEPESAPFDPNTLPPHLRAKLDRISAIRWRILEIIDRQRAARLAAEAAGTTSTVGQQQKETAASPSTEIAAAS